MKKNNVVSIMDKIEVDKIESTSLPVGNRNWFFGSIKSWFSVWKLRYLILRNIESIAKSNDYIHHIVISDCDRDMRDLAMGRWYMYKVISIPEFTIEMDSDMEELLFQYAYREVGSLNKGNDYIDQVRICIETCQFIEREGWTLRTWFISQGVIYA